MIENVVNLQTYIEVPSSLLVRKIEEEAVLLEPRSGTYFGLDAVGTEIFLLIAKHGKLATVYQHLLAEYDVEAQQLERDLLSFAQTLEEKGLVRAGAA